MMTHRFPFDDSIDMIIKETVNTRSNVGFLLEKEDGKKSVSFLILGRKLVSCVLKSEFVAV